MFAVTVLAEKTRKNTRRRGCLNLFSGGSFASAFASLRRTSRSVTTPLFMFGPAGAEDGGHPDFEKFLWV